MSRLDQLLVEAAFLAGFEPSSDDLSADDLITEAQTYLTTH